MATTHLNADPDHIILRIRQLITRLGLSQAAFGARLGISRANMSKYLSGRLPITEGLINKIAVEMNVDKHWLLTGEEFGRTDNGTPVYDIDVTAGCDGTDINFTRERVMGSVNMPGMRPGSVIVRVSGDSMAPTVPHGSYIAIREIPVDSEIQWGRIHVIVMEDYRIVKRLVRHPSDPSKVIIRSENPVYDDVEAPLSGIIRLYIVDSVLNFDLRC